MFGDRQRGLGVTVLGPDHRLPHVHGPTVTQGRTHIDVGLACQTQHLLGQRHGQVNDVGGAAAGEDLDGLTDLECVADCEPQRGGHVGQQRRGLDPGRLAQVDHGPRQLLRLGQVLHEGTRSDLDVEDESFGAFGDLLRHDRGGDERNAVDRRGGVAQCVELLVRRCQAGARGADDSAQVLELVEDGLIAQARLPAGNGLKLVQGSAGVAEAAAGELRDGDIEDRDEWGQRQGDLVPDSPGRMLVRGGTGQGGEVHPLARGDHRLSPVRDLARFHVVDEDRHGQGGHLLIGDDTSSVGIDHPVDLLSAQGAAIAFGGDDVDGIECLYAHSVSPSFSGCCRSQDSAIVGK